MSSAALRETGTAGDAIIVGLLDVHSRLGGNPVDRMQSFSVVARFWLSRL
jgi:hypothetical protein